MASRSCRSCRGERALLRALRHAPRRILRRGARRAAGRALALLLAGCGGASGEGAPAAGRGPGPSVLLVSFDTTRADRIGAYGDADAETPALDALAARGLLFERAWAAAPITLPSHATLLTGLYPHEHGARDNGLYRVPDETLLLAEVLAGRGWRTGAFVGSIVLAPRYGLDQGFEVYDAPASGQASADGEEGVERPAGAVVDAALAWLDTLGADERFLLWVHLFDPHSPYEPPEPWASRHADPYDGEIAHADAQLGRLLEALAARGRDAGLAVIATSDHGESLGEHGEPTHGIFLYDATMRVPLIVVPPGGLRAPAGAPRRVATPVSLADAAPTVLDLLGLPADALPDARTPSLLASAAAAAPAAPGAAAAPARAGDPDAPGPSRALYMESLLPFHQHRWHPLRGLAWDGWKLIDTPRPELYALADDPGERDDLAPVEPGALAAARERMASLLDRHRPARKGPAASSPAEAERKQLEALGYLGSAVQGEAFDATLPLPRERAGLIVPKSQAAERLAEGLAALADGAPDARAILDDARARLQALLAIDASDPQATLNLGTLELALGREEAAIDPLERHALAVPRSARTRYSLARCYAVTGHADWAVAEMQKAVSIDPAWPLPYRWLAQHHVRAGELGRALWWLQELQRRRRARSDAARSHDEAIDRLAATLAEQDVGPVAPEGFPADDLAPEGRRAAR
jgi:arylsulfatase A-like enzyme/Tfp pilus assembly protein PilF